MRKNKTARGVSALEAIIAFVILAVVIGGASALWSSLTASTRGENATTQATQYARRMYPRWGEYRVSCQEQDTDGNGYVTCTIGDGNRTEGIECASFVAYSFNRGCRPMRYGVPTGDGQ